LFVLYFCFLLFFQTINRLPRDISRITAAVREKNHREIWGTAAEMLFFWVLTAIVGWLVIIPIGKMIFTGIAWWVDYFK